MGGHDTGEHEKTDECGTGEHTMGRHAGLIWGGHDTGEHEKTDECGTGEHTMGRHAGLPLRVTMGNNPLWSNV